jgi:hypothetical protein
MISGTRNKAKGSSTPGCGVASALACAVVCLFLAWPVPVLASSGAFSGTWPRGWGGQRGQAAHTAPMRSAPERPPASKPAGNQNAKRQGNGKGQAESAPMRPAFNAGPAQMRPGVNGGARPGHLQEWVNNHQNLSPQQQEEQLRHLPGFNRLTPDQQQRVVNRLRTLDARPPEQRDRMIQRNEMFENLSPVQKADVGKSSEAMRTMPPERQAMVRRAFNDLRQLPPDQRQAILNSARFSQTFSPEERHVLGSFLSIEPYEPR